MYALHCDLCHSNLARQSSLPSAVRLTEHNSWSPLSSESTVTSSFCSASERKLSSIDPASVDERCLYEWLSIIHCRYLAEFTCRFTSISEKSTENRASSIPPFSSSTLSGLVSISSLSGCHGKLSGFRSSRCGRPLVLSSTIHDEVAEASFYLSPR